jgi:hypothetical protein
MLYATLSIMKMTLVFLPVLFLLGTSYAGEPVLPPSVTERSTYSKPFWIEKTMFAVDDTLFVVGLATKATTLEEGRTRSLEAAKEELRGRSKSLGEAKWQDVDTKDIYEERELDGTFTVWRLVSVKTHGYHAFVLDPEKAQEVARILARTEEKKLKAAKESESKELREEWYRKRLDAARLSKRDLNVEGLTRMCGLGTAESCHTLEELDVQIAQLEADGWKWIKHHRQFSRPESWLWNTKMQRYEPPDSNNKDQFKPLPMECYSGLNWLHFKWLQLIGTCRE